MPSVKKSGIRFIFGIFMVLIYLGMAFVLIFTNLFNFNETLRIIIGSLFFLYGVFRAYRVVRYGL